MALPYPDDERSRDEAVFDLIKRRYDSELERKNDLDGKGHNLIGYVSVVVGLLVGVGTFQILDKLSRPEYYTPYFLGEARYSIDNGSIPCEFKLPRNQYNYVPSLSVADI